MHIRMALFVFALRYCPSHPVGSSGIQLMHALPTKLNSHLQLEKLLNAVELGSHSGAGQCGLSRRFAPDTEKPCGLRFIAATSP